ncbi:MAG: NADH:flavin oxidoreductase [Gammaproteobacteria bacterium]|jgi:2,4-dienoyl-CoA reductase-like NADH-dependent reductase (Old Yellow Enzyme family)|nr:NADH:flavin oxidoreductase [Gammaproteobacteria bacterium]
MSDALGEPLTLPCGVTLPNRILKSAMTEGLADDRDRATERHVRLYRRWAEGGAGTLVTGNVMIDRRFLERPGNVVIDDARDEVAMAALRAWAEAGTSAGNQLWMQISHPGRQCGRIVSSRPMAPSEVQLNLMGNFGRPVAMTEHDIEMALGGFTRAAAVARDTGFTGVQVHGAHGYLVSEFLSPKLNRRQDRWGGPLENRARFLLEAVRGVRSVVGPAFPVSVKLNSADFQKGGFSFEDSLQVAEWLDEAGVDLIEISGGNYEQPTMFGIEGRPEDAADSRRESTRRREAFFLEYAARMRERVKAPLAVTGGFRTRQAMADALAKGEVDVVGLARPLCTEPGLPRRLIEGSAEEAVRWEEKIGIGKGRFGPDSRIFLFKALNAFSAIAWYYRQLVAMADGKPLRLDLHPLRALFEHQRSEIRIARARRKTKE